MIDKNGNVCTHIVAHDLCVGCGVCAGVCPANNLTMKWNADGCYQPIDGGRCLSGCHLCLDVCPFQDHEENENTIAAELFGSIDGIEHTQETGYYSGCYVGYANGGYRERGASGGIASWLLATLLEHGDVDRVVCVRPNPDTEKLFVYAVLDNADDVRGASKSAYYPVEMSDVIQAILHDDKRYAIIGLPCFLKAMRLAMGRNALLRKRVSVMIGLVCGHLKSKNFAQALALAISNSSQPASIVFREKVSGKSAGDYAISIACPDGHRCSAPLAEVMPDTWSGDLFMLRACGFCDDVFAEVADAVCMDAWLPSYTPDWRGTSIVLVRSKQIQQLLQAGIEQQNLSLELIHIDQVVASQAGVIDRKRRMLSYRLWLAQRTGAVTPGKRMRPQRPQLMKRLYLNVKEDLRAASHVAYGENQAAMGLQQRNERMRSARRRLACAAFAMRVRALLLRILRMVRGR
ncbi:MAG: Coenzyme F420 hydrogenase/dehydrogenase, beta subunit C-terminal domain [Armatimonadota bacterium]|nr:Coenzyme F420 hydrogenase/dehydrogenase, beta subunit C-terminal domain [bacterium]